MDIMENMTSMEIIYDMEDTGGTQDVDDKRAGKTYCRQVQLT